MNEVIIASANDDNIESIRTWCHKNGLKLRVVDSIQKALKVIFDSAQARMVVLDIPKETQIMHDRLISFFNKTEIPCLILTQNYKLVTQFQKKGSNFYINYVLYNHGGDFDKENIEKTYNKSATTNKLEERLKKFKSKKVNNLLETAIAFLAFEPLTKSLLIKFYSGLTFRELFVGITNLEPSYGVFEYFFLFPIGALALKSKKVWGLGIFILLGIFHVLRVLVLDHAILPIESSGILALSMGLVIFGILIICYTVLPEARKDILNRSGSILREHERYSYSKRCSIRLKSGEMIERCQFMNLSIGGALVISPEPMYEGERVRIFFDESLSIDGDIKRLIEINGQVSLGVQFEFTSADEKKTLSRILEDINS